MASFNTDLNRDDEVCDDDLPLPLLFAEAQSIYLRVTDDDMATPPDIDTAINRAVEVCH